LARAVLDGERSADWAHDFPADGEVTAARWVALGGAYAQRAWPFFSFVLRERSTAHLVGGAGFHGEPRARSVELGYGLAPSARGKGLATEAVCALVAVAGASADVDTIIATCDPDNVGSQRVLRRSGFVAMNDRATLWVASAVTR
jgi:RimJ/RimL family protein N-acetyltransferase